MGKDSITVRFCITKKKYSADLEIPLYITANDLVIALNTAYDLGIDISDIKNCYLKAENPIALLRGNKKLSEYELHDGSIINFTE